MAKRKIFSPSEEEVIRIIGKKKMSITTISVLFYQDRTAPVNDGITIANFVNKINRKCDYHNLNWFLEGQAAGSKGKIVWKVAR